jgi:hypothetical protein
MDDVDDVGDLLFPFTRAFLVILGEGRITDFTDFTYRASRDAAARRLRRDSSCLAWIGRRVPSIFHSPSLASGLRPGT